MRCIARMCGVSLCGSRLAMAAGGVRGEWGSRMDAALTRGLGVLALVLLQLGAQAWPTGDKAPCQNCADTFSLMHGDEAFHERQVGAECSLACCACKWHPPLRHNVQCWL